MAGGGITEDEVRRLTAPTEGFLCPLSANTYGIDFLTFIIRDYDSGAEIFRIQRDPHAAPPQYPPDFDYDQLRSIRYDFPAQFLRYRTVGTQLLFKVGNRPLRDFRMIERHYFRDRLIKSYDFTFDFCIPNSTNEWEAIYDMPVLSKDEVDDLIDNPYEAVSDSFYFVDGELVMHNKASYAYREDLRVQGGRDEYDDRYDQDNGHGRRDSVDEI